MGINKGKGHLTAAAKLRRRAEDRLGEKPGKATPVVSEGEPRKLLHELQVHEMERKIVLDLPR